MYAVILSGGKQYKVQPGEILQVEKLPGDKGSTVSFDQVLLIAESKTQGEATTSDVVLGQPRISGAKVEGEIIAQGRGEKTLTIKMKRRKQYRRTKGHRQDYTEVLILGVSGSGKSATLPASEKEAIVAKYFTLLKPKGLAFTPKISVSRRTPAGEAATETKAGAPRSRKGASKSTAKKAGTKTASKSKKK